ncbi:MAG: DUF4349 domain-containing protein [Clostridiales bacterium]|nr:DUF4349 domain-containing protein [Clostridiales bacterium]
MKKKITIIIAIGIILVMVFAGCAKEASYDVASNESLGKAAPQMASMDDGGFDAVEKMSEEASAAIRNDDEPTLYESEEPSDLSEKIIYNVYASLLCEDVNLAVAAITEKVKVLGGYVSYVNTYTSDGYSYANIEVRVPAGNLDIMEDYSHEIGNVEEFTMNSNNVTESYYDIQARLEHNLAQETQLLELMKEAKTIEDTLLVRAELTKIQEIIESYKGRIRVWDSLVDYSTISYNISPVPTLDTEVDDSPRLIKLDETWRAMKRGFVNTAIVVANFFSWVLRMLVVLAIPLLICGIVAIVVVILVRKGKKKDE